MITILSLFLVFLSAMPAAIPRSCVRPGPPVEIIEFDQTCVEAAAPGLIVAAYGFRSRDGSNHLWLGGLAMTNYLERYNYIEVCSEVYRRGEIFEYPTGYVTRVRELMGTSTGRAFRSVFLYDQSYVDHFTINKSVAGFRGSFWAHEVIIDFDDDESIENARVTTEKVARRLVYDLGVDDKCIEIGFTGHRGFHISFPQAIVGFAPTPHLRPQMIGFLREVIKGCTSTTTKFDESIYKANGLIRISGSCHEKSGNYKIPLTVREILELKMGDILAMSKERRPRPQYLKPTEICPELAVLWPNETDLMSNPLGKAAQPGSSSVFSRGTSRSASLNGMLSQVEILLRQDHQVGNRHKNTASRNANNPNYIGHRDQEVRRGFDRSLLPDPMDFYLSELDRLQGQGEWRVALCPFHEDHKPSLRVNVFTGAFRCFPCGARGRDVLLFQMMRYEQGFAEAARELGAWREG